MKKITVYETTDGRAFGAEEAAALHQRKIDIQEFLVEGGKPRTSFDPYLLAEWLIRDRLAIVSLLTEYSDAQQAYAEALNAKP